MRLVKVPHKHGLDVCLGSCEECGHTLYTEYPGAWADLDARPGTYYCQDCAREKEIQE